MRHRRLSDGERVYRPVVAVSLLRGWAIGGTFSGDVVRAARLDWQHRRGVAGFPELRRLLARPCDPTRPCYACAECGMDLPPERAAALVRWLERTGDASLVDDRWSWTDERPVMQSARVETGRVETVWSWDAQLLLCASTSTARNRRQWAERWDLLAHVAPDAALHLLARGDLPRYVRREPVLLAPLLIHARDDVRQAATCLAGTLS